MSAIFRLQAVQHRYPDGRTGLQDCSIHLRRAGRHAILGPNGSGKTTLLQHLNGLLRPSGGTVHFDGLPLDYGRRGLLALRQQVGLVFQNPDRQLFSANVYEDVSFGPLNLGLDETTVRQRVDQALEAVGMTEHTARPVHELSFGQKKRVCIAGVLAMQPTVLLLDEPMAGLDVAIQMELTCLLNKLNKRGITIIMSSHDVDFAYHWADHVHLMTQGRCISSFAASDLPENIFALDQAGQVLPTALRLHTALSARGLVPNHPMPRNLEEVLAALSSSHPHLHSISGKLVP